MLCSQVSSGAVVHDSELTDSGPKPEAPDRKIVFSTTYRADLNDLGYDKVAALLGRVQKCRNRFTHGLWVANC